MGTMIIIKADTNDADYVHAIIEDEWHLKPENLNRFKKIAQVVKDNKVESKYGGHHNWDNGEYAREGDEPATMYEGLLTKDDRDFFEEYIPYGDYGIHTIVSIRILSTSDEVVIL